MRATLSSFVLLSTVHFASALGPRPGQIKNLVTFGDSYTDITVSGDGGAPWPYYLAGYANLSLFGFAHSGATCSNASTPRVYPGVTEDEIPDYLAERANGTLKAVNDDLEGTMHTLWIGTNDLGVGELITGQQTPGISVVDVVDCVANWARTLYAHGGRNFIFQNTVVDKTILYSANSYPNHYWLLERNTTEWNLFMTEMTVGYNQLANVTLKALAAELPGAHIGLFDSRGLFTDIIAHPANYLNGTAPLNTTGAVVSCEYPVNAGPTAIPDCTIVSSTSDKDSYLWFDELHPSEQTNRIVARNLANAITRQSEKWITWFS